MKSRYWFRPKRWGEVAIYYPVNFPGWVVSLSCLFFLVYLFVIDTQITGNVFHFFLEAMVIFLIFDLFCFRTGEYPHWWSGHKLRHRVHRHHPDNRAHRENRSK